MAKAWSAMDTPAFLGRDLLTFLKVLKALQVAESMDIYSKESSFEILYPTDFMPEDSPLQVHAMENFMTDTTEMFLN